MAFPNTQQSQGNGMSFGYQAPSTGNGFTFGVPKPQVPTSFNFGGGNPAISSQNLNLSQMPLLNFGQQAAPISAENLNLSQSPAFDFNVNSIAADAAGMPMNQAGQGITPDTGMGTGDWLNFGVGAAQTLAGIHYQNEANDIAKDTLRLSRDKYNDYLADKQSLDEAGTRRAEAAKANNAGAL